MGFHFGVMVADDTRYNQARARRDELLAEMQKLQSELRAVDEFITLYERLFSSTVRNERATSDTNADGAPKKRARNVLPPARLAEICRDIILENKAPMTRSELLTALEARGIPLVGSDPSKNLGTIMWRFRDSFVHVSGRGYWPANFAVPA